MFQIVPKKSLKFRRLETEKRGEGLKFRYYQFSVGIEMGKFKF